MDKMWAGRFEKALDKMADDFNSSIHFDKKMYKQDIKGSLEHASMHESLSCSALPQARDGRGRLCHQHIQADPCPREVTAWGTQEEGHRINLRWTGTDSYQL